MSNKLQYKVFLKYNDCGFSVIVKALDTLDESIVRESEIIRYLPTLQEAEAASLVAERMLEVFSEFVFEAEEKTA
jgi:hypothetical protein